MSFLFWIIFTIVFIVIFGTVVWLSRQSVEEDNEINDLTEWICPFCGYHVQMGIECIYCGEKKTDI